MKSLYWRALLWSFAVLVLSFTGFLVISRGVTVRSFDPAQPIGRNVSAQFREAQNTYEAWGAHALAGYLERQSGYYPRLHFYFSNRKGQTQYRTSSARRERASIPSRKRLVDTSSLSPAEANAIENSTAHTGD